MTHEEIEELLGAYALDAVDPEEARSIEAHLLTCPRCRAELDAHREVASALGNIASPVPEDGWQRIAAEIAPAAPAMAIGLAGAHQSVSPIRARRRVVLTASLGAIAAALALVVGLLSARVADLNTHLGQVSSAVAANAVASEAASALLDPKAHVVDLTAAHRIAVKLVVLPSGEAYLKSLGLTPLSSSRTYQLWAFLPGKPHPVSVALLGSMPGWVPVRLELGINELAVTNEPSGGSPQPTSAPLATGIVPAI